MYYVALKIYSFTGIQKYVDTFSSTIGFWLFGYAISGNTSGFAVGEEQDYVFWFFRVSGVQL